VLLFWLLSGLVDVVALMDLSELALMLPDVD
jgi:hypothetical protein